MRTLPSLGPFTGDCERCGLTVDAKDGRLIFVEDLNAPDRFICKDCDDGTDLTPEELGVLR